MSGSTQSLTPTIHQRNGGETDAQLKIRFVEFIGSLAQATETAIEYAINTVQQGLTFQLIETLTFTGQPYPGGFTVVVDDGTGAISAALLNSITAAILPARAAGIVFGVFAPTNVPINVNGNVVASASYSQSALQSQVQSNIVAYINYLGVGVNAQFVNVGAVIQNTPGVLEYSGSYAQWWCDGCAHRADSARTRRIGNDYLMSQSVTYNGSVSSAVTDGSVTYSVTFPEPLTLVQGLTLQIVGGVTWGGYRIDTNVFNLTDLGFQFTVTGGLSPTVPAPVTIFWTVVGLATIVFVPPTTYAPPGNALIPSTQPITIIAQEYTGTQAGCVTDGSITYPALFPLPSFVNMETVNATIVGGVLWGGYTLSVNVFNLTASSFQFTVTGGLSPTVPAPVSVFWTATGLINNQYSNNDWANRLCEELPNAWFPSEALEPDGVVYGLLYALATNFPFHNNQINIQTLQTRIISATGQNLDAISVDYFGTGAVALPRLLGESDSSFRARILANLLEQKSTLAAIQAVINTLYPGDRPSLHSNGL